MDTSDAVSADVMVKAYHQSEAEDHSDGRWQSHLKDNKVGKKHYSQVL